MNPPEIDAFTTIESLTFLQTQNEQVSNTCTQPMYSDLTLANQNTNSSLQNQICIPMTNPVLSFTSLA